MRRRLLACAAMLAATPGWTAAQAPPRPEGTVVRIDAIAGDRTTAGTAFLIHTASAPGGGTTAYFLTAAHLFASASGLDAAGPLRARLYLESGPTLDVGGDRIVMPAGGVRVGNVAIVRGTATGAHLVPVPVTAASPDPGDVFVIVGHLSDGMPKVLSERVRFRSTLFVVGDRTAPDVEAFAGAPAFGPGGVFGFVSELSSAHVPVVALLEPAAGFIARSVPGWGLRTSGSPEFRIVQRTVRGPLLQVGCDAVSAGEIEVPVNVGALESLVDARAALVGTTALRLGDVTVLSLKDRAVKVRFTMIGVPPPALPAVFPPPCQQGQALVTVAVDVVVFPRK